MEKSIIILSLVTLLGLCIFYLRRAFKAIELRAWALNLMDEEYYKTDLRFNTYFLYKSMPSITEMVFLGKEFDTENFEKEFNLEKNRTYAE